MLTRVTMTPPWTNTDTQVLTITLRPLLLGATGFIVVRTDSLRTQRRNITGALLAAQPSNETQDIIAVEHQRLSLCDTYLIKCY